jgi:signal transduction histidine kinase
MVHSEDITSRKRAEQALRSNLRQLEILWTIDRAILSARTLEEIALAALDNIRDFGPFLAANIVLFDWDKQQAQVLATSTAENPAYAAGDYIPMEAFGDLAHLRQNKPFLMRDIRQLAHITTKVDVLWGQRVRSYTSVPMIVDGELIGAMSLGAADPDGFTEQNIDLACHIADSLAIAVDNRRLLARLQAIRERLEMLTRRLVEVQEEERHRLARELHDEIGQTLTAVKINLQTLKRRLDGAEANRRLDDSIVITDRALQQVRSLSLDLRPSLLDDLGLVAALRWYMDNQNQRGKFEAQLVVEPPQLQLPGDLEVACFRIVQEALTNVMRHAEASHVQITLLRKNGQVELFIGDDGVGFDVLAASEESRLGRSMGLMGMEERARLLGGMLDIQSGPGNGTRIRAVFQYPRREDATDQAVPEAHSEQRDTGI